MEALLRASALVDAMNRGIGRLVSWLVLAMVLISAANAVVRKLFDLSSNAWLELQWQLFAAVFMLGAAWTFLDNQHIRIDILSSRLPKRVRDRIELLGHVLFLMPFVLVMLRDGVPFFWRSFAIGEQSPNAGGLPQWPVKALVPLGFFLLFLQGLSEIVKRVAAMRGLIPEPHAGEAAPGHAPLE